MSLPSTRSEAFPETGRRQRPGLACDECRRRKLRCDGQHPQCGVCRHTNVACTFTQRGVRGPKKGHLNSLKNRILHLEAMLESRLPPQQRSDPLPSDHDDDDDAEGRNTSLSSEQEAFASNELHLASTASVPNILVSEILQVELDQLYFDRVHQSIPILHQRRYLSWCKSGNKTASHRCLQYAMWTIASLLSVHSRNLVEPLYQKTKQMLEELTLELNDFSNLRPTLAQAWVLVVTFEYMRTYHRQAWMSAGRAFRLVQAMRYHEIDNIAVKHGASPPHDGDCIEVEEKRRVFWMIYFLDHVISIRNDWPITLNEHVICTRLPAPDADFQSGSHALGPFLSEAMTGSTLKVWSSFNECLILATICGRSLLQRQQYHISKAYGDTTTDLTEQHKWLDIILTSRLQALSQCCPTPAESSDPLLLFVNLLGQATVIHFCKVMTDIVTGPSGPLNENNGEFCYYQQRALEASTNIISIASSLQELPFSRVHPLSPIPLFLCAEFLYTEMHNETFQIQFQELFHVLRGLKNVNNPEQSFLDLLPRSKATELFSHSVETSSP